MASHADQHDLDKLGRWHRELAESPPGSFPVYAIFLVSADDRLAHDIFRKFRSSFEARNAGFENLVIFGQHGISSTTQSLLAEFGLSLDSLPALALVEPADTSRVYTLQIPPGASEAVLDEASGGGDWQQALSAVEAAIHEGNRPLALREVPGLALHQLDDGPLDSLVSRLLSSLT
jgi:hypothetical protein